ncbi:DNA primase, partial [Lactobacillus salivarius]|nr:DNA primase [Ligilactobacillus salivarius]
MPESKVIDVLEKASKKIEKRQKLADSLPSWAFVNSRDIVHAKPDKLGREILKTVKLMYVKNGKDLTLYRYNLDNGLWEIMTKEEIEKIVTNKIDGINAWNAKDVSDTRKYIMNKAIIKQASETIDNVDPFKVHFKNGVYNFITDKLEPNKPENYIFHGRNYNLDTNNTPTPLTDNWLSESVEDAKQYIMEFIGYIFY